jgi:hypothetical protein
MREILCVFRRVDFGEFEGPVVDRFVEERFVDFFQALILRAVEDLTVADGALAGQVEDMGAGEGADDHFQPAEGVGSVGGAVDDQVVAADGGPPALFADDGLVLESGKLIGNLGQAAVDPLRKRQPMLRVQPLEFPFVKRFSAFGQGSGVACPLAPFDRFS